MVEYMLNALQMQMLYFGNNNGHKLDMVIVEWREGIWESTSSITSKLQDTVN